MRTRYLAYERRVCQAPGHMARCITNVYRSKLTPTLFKECKIGTADIEKTNFYYKLSKHNFWQHTIMIRGN
jgi:hypothetical protein